MEIKEYSDRFEADINVDSHQLTISVDKPIELDDVSNLIDEFALEGSSLLMKSKDFFDFAKSRYRVDYIDDLSDPQIRINVETFSVFWWSDKGDENGEAVIGIDFNRNTKQAFQLIVGD